MSTRELERIQADFDRIAVLAAEHSERDEPYDAFLLDRVPSPCASALEIGCGAGRLARRVAGRADSVLGIDASSEMIRLAGERAAADSRLRFVCGEVLTHPFGEVRFDCVITVNTLHHLEAGSAVERMKALLHPGGVLILHDVRAPTGVMDWLRSAIGATVSGDVWWWLRQRLTENRELARAWRHHGAGEQYLRPPAVHALCAERLPGAIVTHHPLWRYTVVWTNSHPA